MTPADPPLAIKLKNLIPAYGVMTDKARVKAIQEALDRVWRMGYRAGQQRLAAVVEGRVKGP